MARELTVSQRFDEWCRRYTGPVTQAVAQREIAEARILLKHLDASVMAVDRDTDTEFYEMCAVTQRWFHFMVAKEAAPEEELGRLHRDFINELNFPVATAGGRLLKARLLLAERCFADAEGYHAISREEIFAYLADQPRLRQDNFVMHHIGSWAFVHRDRELAELASEVLLTRIDGERSPQLYRRISLMAALVAGTATAATVAAYVESITERIQLQEFTDHFRPRCAELGLLSAGVKTALARKYAELG